MNDPRPLEDVAHRLAERVKELTALRQAARIVIDRSLSSADLLNHVTLLLPPAFQFPDVTEGSITHGETTTSTPGYASFPWRLSSTFRTRDGTDGRVEVVYREPRPAADEGPFLIEERHLLDAIAEMLQSALDQRLVEDRLNLLLRLTHAVTSELNLEELLQTISKLIREDVGHHFSSILLWDEDEGMLRRHVLVSPLGETVHAGELVPLEGTPSGLAFRSRKTQVIEWPHVDQLGNTAVNLMKELGIRSICAVPLQTRRECLGALIVGKTTDILFSPDEVLLLEQVTQSLATAIENALAYRKISVLSSRLADENVYLEEEVTRNHEFKELVGSSRALADVLHQVRTVAPTDATVLLLGETGTGKELLARAIHDTSRRRTRAFIRVNSAALPAALVESELFGYEKGAFTGAVSSKAGRLELAHQGTLFLDEIGELPLEIQPKLLRAVQEREFERLGGTGVRRVDARLIAATNRDLEEMVGRGTFRSDLYYRLSVFPIRVPSLRERPEDIPFLVKHFVGVFAAELGRTITTIPSRTLDALRQWPWPGNIRELQNVIERAVIVSRGTTLEVPEDSYRPPKAAVPILHVAAPAQYADGEREMILRALRQSRGVVGGPEGAAARLGLRRTTLQSKMRRLGITRPSF